MTMIRDFGSKSREQRRFSPKLCHPMELIAASCSALFAHAGLRRCSIWNSPVLLRPTPSLRRHAPSTPISMRTRK